MPFKLLILEDQINDLELMLLELRRGFLEFDFQHVTDQLSFKEALDEFQPDIILSDYNIPGYDGLQALSDTRTKYPNTPFIIISGNLSTETSVRYIVDHGVSDIILKDKMERLSLTVKRELDNVRTHKELESTQSSLVERTKELELLSMVASKTHIGVIITNADGHIKWVNKGFVQLTGYSLSEVIDKKPGDFLQGKNTDTETIQEISNNLKLEIPFTSVILNYHKDGNTYWVKLTIDPVFDEQGKLTTFIAIQEDISDNKMLEMELMASNKSLKETLIDKQVLIQEVHHRVKNNLAIINALLTLELFELPEGSSSRSIIERTINRIISIKEAHELLYDNSNLTKIELQTYTKALLKQIKTTFSATKDINVDLSIPNINLDINTLIPLGMLLNELFTNSYKYAFTERKYGNISLHFKHNSKTDTFTVEYFDDGPGPKEEIDLNNPSTLGFEIIHTLLNQLNATFKHDFHKRFYLHFTFSGRTKGSHSSELSLHNSSE